MKCLYEDTNTNVENNVKVVTKEIHVLYRTNRLFNLYKGDHYIWTADNRR